MDPLLGKVKEKKTKRASGMAKQQLTRGKPPQALGECIPGDIVEIKGKTYKVAFLEPHFGHKKQGQKSIFCRELGKKDPVSFRPDVVFTFVEFYKK